MPRDEQHQREADEKDRREADEKVAQIKAGLAEIYALGPEPEAMTDEVRKKFTDFWHGGIPKFPGYVRGKTIDPPLYRPIYQEDVPESSKDAAARQTTAGDKDNTSVATPGNIAKPPVIAINVAQKESMPSNDETMEKEHALSENEPTNPKRILSPPLVKMTPKAAEITKAILNVKVDRDEFERLASHPKIDLGFHPGYFDTDPPGKVSAYDVGMNPELFGTTDPKVAYESMKAKFDAWALKQSGGVETETETGLGGAAASMDSQAGPSNTKPPRYASPEPDVQESVKHVTDKSGASQKRTDMIAKHREQLQNESVIVKPLSRTEKRAAARKAKSKTGNPLNLPNLPNLAVEASSSSSVANAVGSEKKTLIEPTVAEASGRYKKAPHTRSLSAGEAEKLSTILKEIHEKAKDHEGKEATQELMNMINKATKGGESQKQDD